MENKLKEISAHLAKDLFEVKTSEALNQIKVKYLGKAGEISELLKGLRDVLPEARAAMGAKINAVKAETENAIAGVEKALKDKELEAKLLSEKIDVTLTKKARKPGSLHPLSLDISKIAKILTELGFSQVDGPEVEEDKYNFDLLNMPKDHPSRDMQDTFYITEDILLRTQTSNTQARYLPVNKPPFKLFSIGRCYRVDELDATHSFAFYQVEGIYIGEKVSLADLKKTLLTMMRKLFGDEKIKIRFRASYFPFTEPSVEADASCSFCNGKGCPACKNQGWLEMGGAGMVHPRVLELAGIDSTKYSGFAFGFGTDRLSKVNYKVPDMRIFYMNDVRFLSQFGGKN